MYIWNKTLSVEQWYDKVTLNQGRLQTYGNDINKRNQTNHTSYQKLNGN